MNLEDDVVPSQHFVRETFNYVKQIEDNKNDWSSLQFSNYLSIGRFYRCNDLSKLVELILLSYTRQPVRIKIISRKSFPFKNSYIKSTSFKKPT